ALELATTTPDAREYETTTLNASDDSMFAQLAETRETHWTFSAIFHAHWTSSMATHTRRTQSAVARARSTLSRPRRTRRT
ncbi:hypothetical protein, partial [Olsenella sp. DNF00959]|uniref:hypothetical protein n=1 Tax=Olsenella sp. DNF00959 TaxID=1476999 RepID=UPI001E615768